MRLTSLPIDGSMYYATSAVDGLTYQTGPDVDVRAQFVTTGTLNNTQDTNYREIQKNWPVFAFAHNLGDVKAATDPVVVAIGHVRDPVIQYIRAGGEMQERSLYFFSEFSTVSDAVRRLQRPSLFLSLTVRSRYPRFYQVTARH